jgi:hypothetical protein
MGCFMPGFVLGLVGVVFLPLILLTGAMALLRFLLPVAALVLIIHLASK